MGWDWKVLRRKTAACSWCIHVGYDRGVTANTKILWNLKEDEKRWEKGCTPVTGNRGRQSETENTQILLLLLDREVKQGEEGVWGGTTIPTTTLQHEERTNSSVGSHSSRKKAGNTGRHYMWPGSNEDVPYFLRLAFINCSPGVFLHKCVIWCFWHGLLCLQIQRSRLFPPFTLPSFRLILRSDDV